MNQGVNHERIQWIKSKNIQVFKKAMMKIEKEKV